MGRSLGIDLNPASSIGARTAQQKLIEMALASRATAAAPGVAGTPRPERWGELGVYVSPTPPAVAITKAQWDAGLSGYWGWKEIP